jgi:aryl-alcohol dehydrogenase-like predicted oxidoreductase
MDYLDIFMCHRPDPETPLEETIRAMEDLARQVKVLSISFYIGLFNTSLLPWCKSGAIVVQIPG